MKIALLLLACITLRSDSIITAFPPSLTGNHLLPSLLAYWEYDEASGNAPDASGNGRTLTINGGPSSGSGIVNTARVYDNPYMGAAVDYFSRANEAAFAFGGGAFTITAWTRLTPPSPLNPYHMTVISSGDFNAGNLRWWLVFTHGTPNDVMEFYWSTDGTFQIGQVDTFTASGGINADWYFTAVRWDGVNIHISMTEQTDSSPAADVTAAFGGSFYNGGSSPLYVGAEPSSTLHGLNGSIDEMGIWSVYKSDCEIGKLFSAKAGTFSYSSFDSNTCAP